MPLKDGAINEILPFAAEGTESSGDVLPLEEYNAHLMRRRGHQPGIAERAVQNTVNRQVSHLAAGTAQFLANCYEAGIRDDGDLDKIEKAWIDTIVGMIKENAPKTDLSGLVPKTQFATETSMGIAQYATVEEHIEGKVSNRIVNPAGLAARWGGTLGTTGWQRLPSGLLLQWGTIATGQEGMYTVTFPVAFTEACFGFTGTCAAPHAVDIHLTEGYLIIRDITNTQALVWQEWNVSEHGHPSAFYWFALGV